FLTYCKTREADAPADAEQTDRKGYCGDKQFDAIDYHAKKQHPPHHRCEREGKRGDPQRHGATVCGVGTRSRSSRRTASGDRREPHSSGRNTRRCANAGTAIALTSSGVTKSRRRSAASALAKRSRARLPRGEAPSATR